MTWVMPFHSKKRKWFISPGSVKDEHWCSPYRHDIVSGKVLLFPAFLVLFWCSFYSMGSFYFSFKIMFANLWVQVRAESSCGHRRSPGEAYVHPCPQEHALSSCGQPGCVRQPGQAFDKLRSNHITVFSYFTDTRHVTDLSQRVKAYAAFFHLAINMYGITSPL